MHNESLFFSIISHVTICGLFQKGHLYIMVSNPLQSPTNYEPVGAHHCRHSWISGYSIKRKRDGRIVSQWGCVGRQGTLAGLKVIVHRVNSIGFSDVATKDLESDKKLEKKAQGCLGGKYNEANEGEPKLKATA